MRIALAFFGLPRCSRLAWPTIEERLVGPLAQAGELKLFHHLYRQDRVVNPRSLEDHALDPANYEPFQASSGTLEELDERLGLLPVDAFKPYGDAWRDGFGSLRNLLLQLHSLRSVTALACGWNPDVVVFARPDLIYHDAIEAADVERAVADPMAVCLPAWGSWGGFNDRFAICGRLAAPAYGNRMTFARSFCEVLRRPLHAERLLKAVLDTQGASVHLIPLRASRVRTTGRIEMEPFPASAHAAAKGAPTIG